MHTLINCILGNLILFYQKKLIFQFFSNGFSSNIMTFENSNLSLVNSMFEDLLIDLQSFDSAFYSIGTEQFFIIQNTTFRNLNGYNPYSYMDSGTLIKNKIIVFFLQKGFISISGSSFYFSNNSCENFSSQSKFYFLNL